ncbi:hypothetical protein RB195_008905 [Necator americanus]|uniref:Uncharacterized protein n=1 Tax=Necator americanus TaxID=51031 RepID=A0ABR1CQW0_NECAM
MKRWCPVLNTANGIAVGEATLPIWRDYFNILLELASTSVSRRKYVQQPVYATAVSEEPPAESEILVCIRKMKNGRLGIRNMVQILKAFSPSE